MLIRPFALAIAASSAVVAGQAPPAPSVVQEQRLQRRMPGEVMCAGRMEQPISPPRPQSTLSWNATEPVRPLTLRFTIDPDGRPLDIVQEGDRFVPYAEDVGPALAVARFAPGAARGDCRVTFTLTRTRFAQAPLSDLIEYTVFPTNGAAPPALWDRIRPPGSTCADTPLKVLLRAFPDFDAVSATPGTADWSMIGFDIDRKGRPVALRTVASTGNAVLTRASASAVRRSRFGAEARRGCLYPYWRRGGTVAAPPLPDREAYQPPASGCPRDNDWVGKPVLRYPEPYRRRNVEGWAIVSFDVAPWGATGDVKVLAAEPAAEFGEMAKQIIGAATLPRSTRGRVGCTERVRFVIGTLKNRGNLTDPVVDPPTIY